MAKAQSPLLGYNTNVKHKGRVFHIQTEDSGVLKPHVMTHLFADGGRILKSAKTSYAEHLERPDLSAVVKKLMQDQHKAMFLAVREGRFESMFEAPAVTAAESVPPTVQALLDVLPEVGQPSEDADATIEIPETTVRMDALVEEAALLADQALQRPSEAAPPETTPAVVTAPKVEPRVRRFNEATIHERTLDEVILAYLAQELEG